MFESLAKLYTKGGLQAVKDKKAINPYFITHYASFNPETRKVAKMFNRYLFSVRTDILWNLIYLSLPKKRKFQWDGANFVKKKKKEDASSLEKKVMKYFNWSTREYNLEKEFILEHKEFWADKFALDNKQRKEIGLVPIKLVVIKKEKVGPVGLGAWV